MHPWEPDPNSTTSLRGMRSNWSCDSPGTLRGSRVPETSTCPSWPIDSKRAERLSGGAFGQLFE